jgi:L-lactate dehydrogenase complex protein LldG
MDARTQILGSIRRALGRDAASDSAAVDEHLASRARGPRPARSDGDAEALVQRFVDMAQEVSATVQHVASEAAVPPALAEWLARENLPAQLVASPALQSLPWADRPLLALRFGPPQDRDLVSVTPTLAGIAETGTLMLVSGADTPSTLAFLPAVHVALLKRSDIVGAYEDAWARVRTRFGEHELPRTVNFVTGPSRTADIEQRLLLGAHGPRRLHILLIDG